MLTSWQIKNFKAWRDTGPLKLAPLTVILGANSVGKSSLGHLLTALKQTTLASHITQPVDFGDHHSLIDLGSFAQCLHQGVLSEPLSFELQWQLAEPLQLEHLDAQKPCVIDELSLAVSIIADQTQQPVLQTLRYRGYQQGQECVSVAYCSTRPHALQVQLAQPQRHSYQIALEEALAPERFYQLPTENALNAKFIQLFAQQTEAFFAGFHALKALRAMPQRRYVWDGETPANVGAIGELTVAALLAAQAQQRSVQFSDEHSEQGLQETVAQWLQQLGVASAFSVAPLADQPDTYQVLLNNHPQGTAVNLADLG